MTIYVRASDVEPIIIEVNAQTGFPLTGATGIIVRIRRESDGFWLDWDDSTFKGSLWTTQNKAAVEIDSVLAKGLYQIAGGFPTPSVTNLVKDDFYTVFVDNDGSPDTVNAVVPPPTEFRVGFFADAVGLQCVVSATIGSAVPDTLRLIAWLERQGSPQTAGLVSALIEFNDSDGVNLVAPTAMLGPDANGVFKLSVPGVALSASTNYYALVTITDAQGTEFSNTATPTVG